MNLTNAKHLTIGGKKIVRLEKNGSVIWKGLPEGFTPLDHIGTTGTQYINLEFVPNQDTRIVCEFMFFGGSGIYGSRDTTTSDGFCMRVTSSKWQPQYNDTMTRTSIASDTTNWHIADQNKNVFSVDGAVQLTFNYAEFTAPHPVILGGILANREGVMTLYPGECWYRAARVYDNGTLVRDVVSCMSPDGSIGMYDFMVGKFRGNAGTGEFVAGEVRR